MKKFIYTASEIELIHHLKNYTPKKIWNGFVSFIFEYENYHILLEIVEEIAVSKNEYDEALTTTLSKKDEKYIPNKHSELICENKKIDNIYIARTVLYFSEMKQVSRLEKMKNKVYFWLKTILTFKKDPLDEMIADTIGFIEENICHPKSKQLETLDLNYTNLIDVGLLVEIENKYLLNFIQNNGYGFHIWDNKNFYDNSELKDFKELYEFIKIEN